MAKNDVSPQISILPISPEDTVTIRHDVLWPHVSKDSGIIRLADDDDGLHFGAFLPDGTNEPVAVISLFHEDVPAEASSEHKAWRFRKFACLPEHQGKGIGTALLAYTLGYARDNLDADVVWCDARLSTADWYTRQNFAAFGKTFLKNDIEYVRMKIAV